MRRILNLEAIPSKRGRPKGSKDKTPKAPKVRAKKAPKEPVKDEDDERTFGVRNILKQLVIDELTSLGGIAEGRRVIERVEDRYRLSETYDPKVEKTTKSNLTLLRGYIRTAFSQLQKEQLAYIPKRATWSLYGRVRRIRSDKAITVEKVDA